MKPKLLVGGTVGLILGLMTLVLVIILPASETSCGPGTPSLPTATSSRTEPNCPTTGSPVETGLGDGALRVLRCTVAHFGMMDMRGLVDDAAAPDLKSGRAVEFIVGTDSGKGDAIVSFLQENAAAFRVDYLIWKQRSWTPGAVAGTDWKPLDDRGDAARNHLDRVQVTIKDAAPTSTVLAPANASMAAAPGTVNEAGSIIGAGRHQYPISPSQFTVSDTFGARGGTHMGIDMAAPNGTPIYAAADGLVVASGAASGFGDWVVIDSLDGSGRRYSTVYGHMYDNGIFVRTGDIVQMGQHIADVGSNGESSGPHLHFELVPGGRLIGGHQVDPMPWLAGGSIPVPSMPYCENGFGTAGGNLASGRVPAELEIWYRRAGSLCPEISASLLAAQAQAESGFRADAVSPDGAQGIAQFMPGTAKALAPDGQPYIIDADGDGVASALEPADGIIGQGRYMCSIAKTIEGWMSEGKVSGDLPALTIAAYNAGEGAVLASGGMPNQIARHFTETRPYVQRILAAEPGFRSLGSDGRFQADDRADLGPQIVAAGQQWLGTPYVFGGGGPGGPTDGGFDQAGFTAAAVFAASGSTVTLPRTAEQQWEQGVEIQLINAKPGDLVFGAFGPRGPSDVGVYTGSGRMLHAESGGKVAEVPLSNGMKARRIGR
ncbi:peptidoglycan DD-metalloendopeptidase family protein [Nocardia seriolae]|uniref:peptidoglycan DD-metalloendopeptidase family protein n=1 Tax=Nocardia seriolae TaxID=37332 RepID=UPI000A40F8FA|nr:peptidoglycan DD-metalloendopeptidase family protein [Nocardia seriolae]WNJ61985.1 peptidoglycan DD-metalloendopeptidase family protein [Nocardia seriolae]